MNPLLKRHFSNFKDLFGIEIPNNLKPNELALHESSAFEKFVNNTIFSLEYPEIYAGEISQLNHISIGGGSDTGIDGIGIVVNDSLIRNTEDLQEILRDKSRKIEYDFVFIQSKMHSGFDAGEFNTFALGVDHFLSAKAILPENQRLKEFRKLRESLDSEEVNRRIKRNPNLLLYYVTTGNPPTDQHLLGTKELIEKRFDQSSYYFNKVEIKLIDGKTLIGFCDELENNFQVRINILDTFPLIVGNNEQIKKAYVFTCTALEYIKILKKEDQSLRKHLFSDNVRDYLGSKEGSVNGEIERSIIHDPEMFLLCNNGVTIVCSDFSPIKDKLVQIDNPQIVNGCQTSTTIFKQKDSEQIKSVKLLVRLICTEDFGISSKIVRGTNKQNQVLEEAFETTLPFHQNVLERFFLAYEASPKLYYERRAKQYTDSAIKKNQIVNMRILAQAFTAMFLAAPHESYLHEKIILENYGGDIRKRKIFRDDHSEYPYYTAAATWFLFEKYIYRPEFKQYDIYKHHLYLIYLCSFGESVPKLSKGHKIETFCKKIMQSFSEQNNSDRIRGTFSTFDKIRETWVKQGGSKHGIKDNKLFTDLILAQTPKVNDRAVDQEGPTESRFQGKILRVSTNPDGRWYSFINCKDLDQNIYFDSRSYKGSMANLTPRQEVAFTVLPGSGDKLRASEVVIA